MRDLLSSLLTKEQIGEIALNFFRKEQSSEKSKNMFFVCFYTFSKLFTLIMPKSESLKSLFAQSLIALSLFRSQKTSDSL